MTRDTIVQFVCFVTDLNRSSFVQSWEPFAEQLVKDRSKSVLHEALSVNSSSKFRYISRHESDSPDFRFAFMKGRSQTDFPEHNAKVVQLGGYSQVQIQCKEVDVKDDVKVIAFLPPSEADLGFYHRQTYRHLNIFEAYFENCNYSYVLEFFIQNSDASSLIRELKTKSGLEAGLYHQCPSIHSKKKLMTV